MLDLRTTVLLGMIFPALACGSSTDQPSPSQGGRNAGGAVGVGGSVAGAASGAPATTAGTAGSNAGAAGSSGGTAGGGSGGGAPIGTCTPPEDVFSPIEKLTLTGCVDPVDPRKPIARAVPYELNSPLWSDGSDKTRAFVLPAGTKIDVLDCKTNAANCPYGPADDGRWQFPVGTVLIKTFAFDNKLVETRLFMHLNADNWVGYGYAWNESQTEATIANSAGADVMFNTMARTVPWHYPSQKDCLDCHNRAGGSTIGPETAQMNRVVGGMNQIDRFASLGLFSTAPAKPYKAALVTPYAGQLGGPQPGATVEQKARSYLHANCGFCHRPGSNFPNFDLRYDTSLKDMTMCNVESTKGPIASAPGKSKLMVPGSELNSLLWLRMNVDTPEKGRMPQIATYAVDPDGVTVVGDWLKSVTACPP